MSQRRIHIGGLPSHVEEHQLKMALKKYTDIEDISLMPNSGYGFVQFKSPKVAEKFIEDLNQTSLWGNILTVQYARALRKDSKSSDSSVTARSRSSSRPLRHTVMVTNIPPGTIWQDLKDFGRLAGGLVAFCDLDKKKQGRGFIEYVNKRDADRAVRKLNKRKLGSNVVCVAHPKGSRVFVNAPRTRRSRSCPRSRSPMQRRDALPQISDELEIPRKLLTPRDNYPISYPAFLPIKITSEESRCSDFLDGADYERHMRAKYEREWETEEAHRRAFIRIPRSPLLLM